MRDEEEIESDSDEGSKPNNNKISVRGLIKTSED
jgi:hypothetical protein